MDYEQEWKGVAIQTNGDDNYAAASAVKFSLAKPIFSTSILL